MRRAAFLVVLFALLAFAASPSEVRADGFNKVIENDRVLVRLDYPVEVKISSCFDVQVDVVALSGVEGLVVNLKLVFHGDSLSTVLLDTKLVDGVTVAPGESFKLLKTVNVCLPRAAPPDPFIEANLSSTYRWNNVDFNTVNVFFMSIVRSRTYEEVVTELSIANSRIANLRSQVNQLQSEIKRLSEEIASLRAMLEVSEAEAEDLRASYEELLKKYAELTSSYETLSSEYESLKSSYEELNARYMSLLEDYGSLQGTYESLRGNFETLDDNYRSLRSDYEAVSRELSSLRAMYKDLSERHSRLRENYEESVKMVGSLEGSLREKERENALLRARLEGTVSEGNIIRSIAAAQAVGIAALGTYMYRRLRLRSSSRSRPEGRDGQKGDVERQADNPARETDHTQNPEYKEQKLQKVLSGRRITIPAEVATKLGLRVGDIVEISYSEDSLTIKRADSQSRGQPEVGPA